MKVLVTGANGFVGRALCRHLAAAGHSVIGGVRSEIPDPGWMEARVIGDLETRRNFSELVSGADAVVHLAARVHKKRERSADTEAAYRRANADVTENLSRAAADAGVRRFVFLSSVKVNGERTINGAYTEENEPAPEDAYGRSKLAAEQALRKLSGESGLACVSLRVPLVYGPSVGANFAALLGLCNLPLPLPLSGITANRRSLLFLGNLNGAIRTVLEDPADHSATFLLSDGEDLSTADLVRRLRHTLNRRVPDLSVPASALRTLAGLASMKLAADRLCGSLQIDSSCFRQTYHWTPTFSVDQGLAATVAWRLATR